MTLLAPPTSPAAPEHIVLTNVSWSYYEHTLAEIGKQPIRVAYLDGMMEIMSILPEHEGVTSAIGDLVKILTFERGISRKCYRSTTFRREEKSAGIEPDDCFYLYDIDSVKAMKRFDPLIHRAPDLWIEVDIFNPSLPREPIYARLGVPELWRYNGKHLEVRLLAEEGAFKTSPTSRAFPFLPMMAFAEFIPKMIDGDEMVVTREFRDWVLSLPR